MKSIPNDVLLEAIAIDAGEPPAHIGEREFFIAVGIMAGRERYEQAAHLIRILICEPVLDGVNGTMTELYNRLPEVIFRAVKKHVPDHVTSTRSAGGTGSQRLSVTKAQEDVLNESGRQITDEGWGSEYDDHHAGGLLAVAAASYALTDVDGYKSQAVTLWPWNKRSYNPTARRQNLVKAAALIISEIERLDRIG